jgi:hypothetical protein
MKPDHWCKGTGARDINGEPVNVRNNLATSWCLLGAIELVANDFNKIDSFAKMRNKIESACKQIYNIDPAEHVFLSQFNDTHEHSDILKVIVLAANLRVEKA